MRYLLEHPRKRWPNTGRPRRPARVYWHRRRWGRRWPCRCVRQSRWLVPSKRNVSLVCNPTAEPRRWDPVRSGNWRWIVRGHCRPPANIEAEDSRLDRRQWRLKLAFQVWRLLLQWRRRLLARKRDRCRSDPEFAGRRGPSPFYRHHPWLIPNANRRTNVDEDMLKHDWLI